MTWEDPHMYLAIGAPGLPELLVLLVVVLLVLGPKRLTGVGRSLGTNAREFKDSITGGDKDEKKKAKSDLHAAPHEGAAGAPAPHEGAEETVTGEPVPESRRTPRT
jgi:sec-independent protein translocase protein TatA